MILFQIRQENGLFIEKTVAKFDTVNGLESVVSTINMRATPESFKSGMMKLRCTATMFNMYASSDEIELLEDAPQVALIMVPLDHTNTGTNSNREIA